MLHGAQVRVPSRTGQSRGAVVPSPRVTARHCCLAMKVKEKSCTVIGSNLEPHLNYQTLVLTTTDTSRL